MSVDVVHVVVPAHDEEELVGACLASVATAAARLGAAAPGVVVRTTVVLDRCTDGTAAVVATYGVDTVVVDAASVGVARAAGVDRVAELAAGHPAERVLVVSTDADCVVPDGWLVDLHARVAAGHDLVVGAVHPDPADLPVGVLDRWWARHRRPEAHVHCANLAFTLAAHALVGGLQPVDLHEDVLLVEAMRAAGCRWTTGTSVQTSGRTTRRATSACRAGFATRGTPGRLGQRHRPGRLARMARTPSTGGGPGLLARIDRTGQGPHALVSRCNSRQAHESPAGRGSSGRIAGQSKIADGAPVLKSVDR